MKGPSATTVARAAQTRHDLLRANTRDEVVAVGKAALREALGLTAAEEAIRFEAPGEAPVAAPGDCVFELTSRSGHDHGRLVVRFDATRMDELRPELRALADDVAHALDNAAAALAVRDVARLRQELGRRDVLVKQAGDALMRDAHEVVRVVAELEQRDALIHADLQQALRFQKAMVAALPTDARTSMSSIYLAAELISGDFYDVALLDRDWLRIFVADATGHGVAAGLATMFIKSEYESQKRLSQSPAAVLRAINEKLSSTYKNLELQFTALLMDLDVRTGRLVYASAAHPGPFVVREGKPTQLASGGTFVGVVTGIDFPEHEDRLMKGDLLVAFTDGLLDAVGPQGQAFGESRIVAALSALAAARATSNDSGAEACPALVRALAEFVGEGRGLEDDATIVALSLVNAS